MLEIGRKIPLFDPFVGFPDEEQFLVQRGISGEFLPAVGDLCQRCRAVVAGL